MKITIKNLQKRIPISPSFRLRIRKLILKVISGEGIKKSGQITICLVNNKTIRELNFRYLGKNSPTDVLVFDLTGKDKSLNADIIISLDTAISNARIFKTAPLSEMYLYTIHGMLHLLGYDDKNAQQRRIMHKKEKEILEDICPSIKPKP